MISNVNMVVIIYVNLLRKVNQKTGNLLFIMFHILFSISQILNF